MGLVKLATNAGPNTGSPYTAIPLEGAPWLKIRDEAYTGMVRRRLNFFAELPPNAPHECPCGESLRDSPTHGLHCPKLKRKAVLSRHNWLTQIIQDVVFIGGAAEVEPTCYLFPDGRHPVLRIVLGGTDPRGRLYS